MSSAEGEGMSVKQAKEQLHDDLEIAWIAAHQSGLPNKAIIETFEKIIIDLYDLEAGGN